jgi:hypothetical protein
VSDGPSGEPNSGLAHSAAMAERVSRAIGSGSEARDYGRRVAARMDWHARDIDRGERVTSSDLAVTAAGARCLAHALAAGMDAGDRAQLARMFRADADALEAGR